MTPSRSIRGEGTLAIFVILGLLGLGGWGLSKTKWFHGESKRATASTETTATLDAAHVDQQAKASATFQKIGETNAEAPESPQKRVIARFVPIGLGLTGAPDPAFLLELEKLKVAELTGKLAQADKISATLLQDAAQMRQDYAKALAAKRAADLAHEQAAAEARGAEQQAFWLMLVAGAAAVLYVWTKLSHVSPLSLSAAVRDLREGTTEPNAAIASLDANLTPFQQGNVALSHWVRRKLSKLSS
jgi:hypothetical protein